MLMRISYILTAALIKIALYKLIPIIFNLG